MDKLDQWRKENGLSWVAAAEKLGISRGYLHNLCTGKKPPSAELMIRIQEVTGCIKFEDWKPIAEKFFGGHAEEPASDEAETPSQSDEKIGMLL